MQGTDTHVHQSSRGFQHRNFRIGVDDSRIFVAQEGRIGRYLVCLDDIMCPGWMMGGMRLGMERMDPLGSGKAIALEIACFFVFIEKNL